MLTFEILEKVFFGLLTVGLIVFLIGFSLGFMRITSKDMNVQPGLFVKIGCAIMALSLIPMVMTMFV